VKCISDYRIKYATFFTFSTENWNRPQNEVKALMNLLESKLEGVVYARIAVQTDGTIKIIQIASRQEDLKKHVEKELKKLKVDPKDFVIDESMDMKFVFKLM